MAPLIVMLIAWIVARALGGAGLWLTADSWSGALRIALAAMFDAIDRQGESAPTRSLDISNFIERVLSSDVAVFPSVGEGEDVRLTGGNITGAALVARGRAIHVSAFATATDGLSGTD
jgi:hypothetical protein